MLLVSLVQPCTSKFVVHRYLVCIFFLFFPLHVPFFLKKKETNNTCLCGNNSIILNCVIRTRYCSKCWTMNRAMSLNLLLSDLLHYAMSIWIRPGSENSLRVCLTGSHLSKSFTATQRSNALSSWSFFQQPRLHFFIGLLSSWLMLLRKRSQIRWMQEMLPWFLHLIWHRYFLLVNQVL